MSKQISIGFPSFSDLIINKGEDATTTVNVTFAGGYQSGGRSLAGLLRLERENVPRKNEYTINALGRLSDTVLLKQFLDLIEVDPNRQFTLTDRWNFFTATSASWHNRTIVETFTSNGTNLHYVAMPALLFVPQGINPIVELGAGFYRMSFIASEL